MNNPITYINFSVKNALEDYQATKSVKYWEISWKYTLDSNVIVYQDVTND